MEWFESKVSFETIGEDGENKKVSENYLVEAENFSDAENIVTEKVLEFINGEVDVKAVKKHKFNEIFKSETGDGSWFKAKVTFIVLDEVSGKEKSSSVVIYQQSEDFFKAATDLKKNLSTSMADYIVKSINQTKIVDIFESKKEELD